MKSYVPGWVWGLFALGIWACEKPNISTERLDPAIRATFIDVDSILSMEQSIDLINSAISQANDSLAVIDSLLLAGDPGDYTEEIASLNNAKETLTAERTEVNSQLSEVSTGNIRIDVITATGASKDILYDEAREIYRLPLDARNERTEFFILYNGTINSATFTYQSDTLLENRVVKIIGKNLALPSFDYDSARLSCDVPECTSENANVIFYL